MKRRYSGWDEVERSGKLNPDRRIPERVAGVSGGRRRSQSSNNSFQLSELLPLPLCEGCPELTPLVKGVKVVLVALGNCGDAGVVYDASCGRVTIPQDATQNSAEIASLVEGYRVLEDTFRVRTERCNALGIGFTAVQVAEVQCGADLSEE